MSLTRSHGKSELNWFDMAKPISEKLFEAYEQLMKTEGSCIRGLEGNDLNTLTDKRDVNIGQLEAVLKNFDVPDLIDIPAETQITNLRLANLFLGELKELCLTKENLSSNVANLEDLLLNRDKRNANLVEIIKGLKKETEAIEDENDEDELKLLRRMKRDIKEVLDTILDEAYPKMKHDVKNVIQELYQAKDLEDPFIQVPENVDVQAINLLLTAKIISLHETDPCLIRLMTY